VAAAVPRARVRLNLLPPEIPAAKRARSLVPLCIILIVLSLAGTGVWCLQWQGASKKYQARLDEIKKDADKVDQLVGEIATEKGKVEPLRNIRDFLDQFETAGSKYADVVEALSHYIPASCSINTITINSNSVSFSTVAEDTEHLVKLLTNINRAAMPQEGGGTEPLWSDDAVSRGPLKPLFSGNITFSASLGGLTVADRVPFDATNPLAALSVSPGSMLTSTMPANGSALYQNGILWESPIPVSINATLAEPITVPTIAASAAAGGAGAAASPGAAGTTPGAAGSGSTGGGAAAGGTGGTGAAGASG